MTRTTVHLLRHGEVHNPDAVLYGRLPGFRLSEDGQQMAVDAAKALEGRDITAVVAARMLAAVRDVRDRVPGREAVCVSHQLPIWTVRRHVEGRTLWHRPDWRQCGLASLTSLTWEDDRIVTVTYSEPAGAAARRPGAGA